MHQPNPIDIAAKASGEPVFREVGVGPWAEAHLGEPRPDDRNRRIMIVDSIRLCL